MGHVGKNKSAIIKANQEGKSVVFVLKVSDRKKKCSFEVPSRSQRARPSIQGYVKFPAIPMIKHTGERKYSFEK